MAVTVIQNQFDGGVAEDVRSHRTNECESSDNFDCLNNSYKISPHIGTALETMTSGVTTDFALTDVDSITVAGSISLVALGRVSSGNNSPSFYRKGSTTDITSSWQHYADGANTKVDGSLVVYKGDAYCLGDTNTAHNLQKFDGYTTVSTIGTITNTNYTSIVPRPFVHPEDNILYMADGNIIASYNGSSFTASAFVLPSDKIVVSLTNYGGYLVVACRPKNGAGKSTMYFWGRDTSNTLIQESIDLGNVQVNIVENIENQLVVVSTKISVGQYSSILNNKLTISMYTGGAMQVIKELPLSSSLGTALNNMKVKKGNKLYFCISGDTSIYVFGKNKSGQYVVARDKGVPTGATFIYNFSIISDFMWISYAIGATSYYFSRTLSLAESQNYPTSTYKTTINPSMSGGDRDKNKQLEAIQVTFSGTGTGTLKYYTDGGSVTTLGSASITTFGVLEASTETTGIPLKTGREYQFQIETSGNLSVTDIRYRYSTTNQLV